MSFDVFFYSDHALLWSVRYALKTFPVDDENPFAYLAVGTACVLSSAAALEAITNDLIQKQGQISHWDELRLSSKIDTIAELEGDKIDWGRRPWQDVRRLIVLRNWLAHYKNPYVGLSNSKSEWIIDNGNKQPRFDPEVELREESIRRLYDSTREAEGISISVSKGFP